MNSSKTSGTDKKRSSSNGSIGHISHASKQRRQQQQLQQQQQQHGVKRTLDDMMMPQQQANNAVWLPEEVMPSIFRFLITPDFPAAALVCKSWASLIKKGMDGVILVSSSSQSFDKHMMTYSTKHNTWNVLQDSRNPSLRDDDADEDGFGLLDSEIVRQGRYMWAVCPDRFDSGICSTLVYDPYSKTPINRSDLFRTRDTDDSVVVDNTSGVEGDSNADDSDDDNSNGEEQDGCADDFDDDNRSDWIVLEGMACEYRSEFGLAAARDSLFVVGGKYSGGEVEVCDLKQTSPQWKGMPKVLHDASSSDREMCCAAALNGALYVLGGVDYEWTEDGEVISAEGATSVERLKLGRNNSWEYVSPLNNGRWRANVVAVGGSLYAFGGLSMDIHSDPFAPEMSVEQYNPDTNTWSVVSTLPTPRTGFATIVVGNSIYVIGGHYHPPDETRRRETASRRVEIFDTESKVWTEGAPMPDQEGDRDDNFRKGTARTVGASYARFD